MADFLPSANEHRTMTKSSIAQAKGKVLSIYMAGRYVPVVFDHIDYIDCDKVVSRRETISSSDELAYNYPVGHCNYFSEQYVQFDKEGVVAKPMPCWFGDGWYREYIKKRSYVNFDDQAFGILNKWRADIGLHYVEAVDTLD